MALSDSFSKLCCGVGCTSDDIGTDGWQVDDIGTDGWQVDDIGTDGCTSDKTW